MIDARVGQGAKVDSDCYLTVATFRTRIIKVRNQKGTPHNLLNKEKLEGLKTKFQFSISRMLESDAFTKRRTSRNAADLAVEKQ